MPTSIGERESLFVIFYSLSVFLLEWREFCLLIFIATLSSSLVIEESASGVSQPLFCSVQENLQWLCTNKTPCSKTPCICVLCLSGLCQCLPAEVNIGLCLTIQVTLFVVFYGVIPPIAWYHTKTHPTLPTPVFCLTAAFRPGSIRTYDTIWVVISLIQK